MALVVDSSNDSVVALNIPADSLSRGSGPDRS